MTDTAIRVENVSKLHRIGAKQERYRTLRHTLTDAFTAPIHRVLNSQFSMLSSDPIWALKDVFLEVKQGEVDGIIGRTYPWVKAQVEATRHEKPSAAMTPNE
jgi:lipopolysaccharide transport system ATP-binding protein